MPFLRPRVLAKEVDVQLLEWPLSLYSLTDSDHHTVIRRLRLLAALASSNKFPNLQHHPGPVELPPKDLHGLPHSAVCCLWVRMGSLYQAVGQTLRYPELPRRSVRLVVQSCRGGSLEDEPVLNPKIRKFGGLKTQQLCQVHRDLLHASRKRVCHHVLATFSVFDCKVKTLELQRPPGQASRQIFHGHQPLQANVIRDARKRHAFHVWSELPDRQEGCQALFFGDGVIHLVLVHLRREECYRMLLVVLVLLEKNGSNPDV
ncbi:uncharacterized protein LOC110185385 [Drosophila serrata]|uniref:uncharacterized protein LOC110185385 n=1 Tax=Drosophila serrata TaxID=7274 RepID=UPI000A1D0775|nr:uncharacterized protein LOC110185385 [Drosophila serrata]